MKKFIIILLLVIPPFSWSKLKSFVGKYVPGKFNLVVRMQNSYDNHFEPFDSLENALIALREYANDSVRKEKVVRENLIVQPNGTIYIVNSIYSNENDIISNEKPKFLSYQENPVPGKYYFQDMTNVNEIYGNLNRYLVFNSLEDALEQLKISYTTDVPTDWLPNSWVSRGAKSDEFNIAKKPYRLYKEYGDPSHLNKSIYEDDSGWIFTRQVGKLFGPNGKEIVDFSKDRVSDETPKYSGEYLPIFRRFFELSQNKRYFPIGERLPDFNLSNESDGSRKYSQPGLIGQPGFPDTDPELPAWPSPESLDGVVLLNSPDVEISKYINLSQFKGFWRGKLINAEKVHPYGENEDITQTVRNECLNKKGIYQFDCISEVDIGFHNVTKTTKLKNEQYIELNFSNILRLEVNRNTLNYNINAYTIGILGERTPAIAYLLAVKNRIGKYYLAIGNKFATTLYRVIDDNTLENITYRSEQIFSSKTNYFPAHRYVHILSK